MLLQIYLGDFFLSTPEPWSFWQWMPQKAALGKLLWNQSVFVQQWKRKNWDNNEQPNSNTVKGAALQETSDYSELWSANVMNHKSPLKWEQTYKFFLFQYVQIPKQFWVVNLHSLRTICSSLLYSTSLFRNSLYIGFDVLLKYNACLKGGSISDNTE